jgi:hypothetical protein
MRIAAIVCAALALSSCEVHGGVGVGGSVFVPAAAVGAIISPTVVTVVPVVAVGCPFVPPFSTDFTLVISGSSDLFVQGVTIRLIDGSGVGGPTLTFPQAELDRRFGSTLVVAGGREFAFHPQFGCGVIVPRAITADVVVADRAGRTHTLTARASVR